VKNLVFILAFDSSEEKQKGLFTGKVTPRKKNSNLGHTCVAMRLAFKSPDVMSSETRRRFNGMAEFFVDA